MRSRARNMFRAAAGKGLVAGYDPVADSMTRGAIKALPIERFGMKALKP